MIHAVYRACFFCDRIGGQFDSNYFIRRAYNSLSHIGGSSDMICLWEMNILHSVAQRWICGSAHSQKTAAVVLICAYIIHDMNKCNNIRLVQSVKWICLRPLSNSNKIVNIFGRFIFRAQQSQRILFSTSMRLGTWPPATGMAISEQESNIMPVHGRTHTT